MIKQIAEITGLRFSETDADATQLLSRIAAALPDNITVDSKNFEKEVLKAEKLVNEDSGRVFTAFTNAVTKEPVARVLKIKSSPKGIRSSIPAANGIRYAFGPIWNESIKKGEGISLIEANKPKLVHQANLLGIKGSESKTCVELVALISPHLA